MTNDNAEIINPSDKVPASAIAMAGKQSPCLRSEASARQAKEIKSSKSQGNSHLLNYFDFFFSSHITDHASRFSFLYTLT